MSVSLKIKIFDNKGTHVLQIAKSTLTIGSAAHCDVVLSHASVHAEHTRAWLEGGRIWVQDLGGSHGTFLNDIRLPSLKPMLVRELDVLRLGESDATLNLEAIAVRQPVVKPAAAVTRSAAAAVTAEETPAPESLEATKRREELEKLGRELAEVRLQLQVAKLDRDADQERTTQVESLREEIKNVREQQGKWTESLRQMENEKVVLRKKAEAEIAEFKVRLQSDLKGMREQDQTRFAAAKKQMVTDLQLEIRSLSNQKVRSWATRPLSQEMIGEWETDLNQLMRKQILGETAAPVVAAAPAVETAAAPVAVTTAAAPTPAAAAKVQAKRPVVQAVPNPEAEGETAKIRIRKVASNLTGSKTRLKNAGRASLVGIALILVLIGAGRYIKMRNSAASLSSQAPMVHQPAQAGTHLVLKQTNKYRTSYTDNVLYLQGYLNNERDAAFHGRYLGEMLKTATDDWKMDQWNITPIMGKEQALIQDLTRMSAALTVEHQAEGIEQMRAREAQFVKELEVAFKSEAGVERFMKFKKTFYQRNQKL